MVTYKISCELKGSKENHLDLFDLDRQIGTNYFLWLIS